jgi:hypothetical protein
MGEKGFLITKQEYNAIVVAYSMQSLYEITTLSGVNQLKLMSKNLKHILIFEKKVTLFEIIIIVFHIIFAHRYLDFGAGDTIGEISCFDKE